MVRRVPLFLAGESGPHSAFALELAGRFLGAVPEVTADGEVRLGNRIVQPTSSRGLLVNFDGGAGASPIILLPISSPVLMQDGQTSCARLLPAK